MTTFDYANGTIGSLTTETPPLDATQPVGAAASKISQWRTWVIGEIDRLAHASEKVTRAEAADVYWDLNAPAETTPAVALSKRALDAMDYLRARLNLSTTAVADLARISRNTVSNWKQGRDAYPATVRRLFQIANLLEAAESTLGSDAFASWLAEPRDGVMRSEWLARDDGPEVLGADIAAMVFARPTTLLPDRSTLLEDEEEFEPPTYAPELFEATPRRQPTQG